MKLNGVSLDSVSPGRSVRFSVNLYCWLLRSCNGAFGPFAHVYRGPGNRLALGVIDEEGDFVGQYLDRVLEAGEWATPTLSMPGARFEEVPRFWESYLSDGTEFLKTLMNPGALCTKGDAALAATID